MAQPVIAIRPEPGLSQTIERARHSGLEISGYPLFEVRGVEWTIPDDLAFDGILIGSANAIRHGGAQLAFLLDLPVYAVGETTANVAEEAGFTIAKIGTGGLQTLLDTAENERIRFLRLSGHDHIALSPARLQTIVERTVYRSDCLAAPDALCAMLGERAIVMLHSAYAAGHFANECKRMGVEQKNIRLAALGPRIAAAAGDGWAEIAVAPQPSDAALLAMIKNMCK